MSNFDPDEHEHDADGNCLDDEGNRVKAVVNNAGPNWSFSLWDIAGVATMTLGGVLGSFAQGAQLVAQEFAAKANYNRGQASERRALQRERQNRRLLAEDLRSLEQMGGDQ